MMFDTDGRSRPRAKTFSDREPSGHDSRNLIHKKDSFLRRKARKAAGMVISSLPIPGAGIIGGLVGGGGGSREQPCPPGFQRGPGGICQGTAAAFQPTVVQREVPVPGVVPFFQRIIPGGETGFETVTEVDYGEAVLGQYGAALEPAIVETDTRRCPRGSVLAKDGLCYNKRDISNKERMWPVGRRPLLTGGEMRAITVASSAAKKLTTKTKQLQRLGMMKKPTRGSRRSLPAGHHTHVSHN